ncbi:molybdopterin-binding protein [Saccharomonospora piscinae]|uniref:Molybdopterin-binding protein n=1 Tax=Saccharomonospora piscinae TaxID=687388 RepID=A0A1V9AC63_SACPI|nr:molybdopterin-dependent oxidoreductase [Saccharomonospora piscinae]OQO94670.1 molybdopterin-binding protein [Saccharomonospora piscinae]
MTGTPQRRELPRLSRPAAAGCGVLALVAALASGHVVAGFVDGNASPFLAVGNTAIDLSPAWLKDWAVRTFGTADKLVLLGGMAVVLVGVAVVAGLASRRSPRPGTTVVAALGLVGLAAVLARPDLGGLAVLAPLASGLVGVAVFRWLHRLARSAAMPRAAGGASRRSVLLASAGVAAGSGVSWLVGEQVGTARDAAGSRARVGRLVAAEPAPPIPPGADFARAGTPTFLTPNRDFYRVDTALVVPQLRAEDWELRVHGLVERELRYTYADIRNRPLVERTITMTCVSNEVGGPYVSTANFLGVDLAELLAEAGVRPEAQQVFSTSSDGWTAGTPVAAATERGRGAMLAIGMNGEPLPLRHGFPARLVVPGLYGYVSATKWVVDLELTTWAARQPYWLNRGWAERAPIKTQSRIERPQGFDTVRPGRLRVVGVAWAQHTGITRVEVRLDDGPWQEAELAREVNVNTWRMWSVELDVPAGSHRISCRATDSSGVTQTEQRSGTVPDGATGWHTVSVTAR